MDVNSIELEKPNPYHKNELPGEGLLIMLPERAELTNKIIETKPWKKPQETKGFPVSGHRASYHFKLDGNSEIIVKHKGTLAEYRMYMGFASELDDSSRKSHILRVGRSTFSILNELTLIQRTRKRWRDTYGEDLSIEKPIGGFISKDGRKYIFFDYTPDEIPPSKLTKEMEEERLAWKIDIVKKIRTFGIEPNECDALIIKDTSSKGYHFLLVDAEKWLGN